MYKKIISVMSVALVVFLCSSFNVFADVLPGSNSVSTFTFDLDGTSDNILRATVQATSYFAYEDNYIWGSHSQSMDEPVYGQRDVYKVYVRLIFENLTAQDIQIDNTNFSLMFTLVNPTDYQSGHMRIFDIDYISGLLTPSFLSTTGEINFKVASDSSFISTMVIPARSMISSEFEILYEYFDINPGNVTKNPPYFGSSGITWQYPTLPFTYRYVTDKSTDNFGYIRLLYLKFKEFLASYQSNVPASDDLTDQSQDVTDTIDNQHQQEANYFEDTQDAIEDTGIRNFQFDAQSISGLHGIRDDFDAVFLSLGNLKSYFIASLTIGLALSIIRHRRMFEK